MFPELLFLCSLFILNLPICSARLEEDPYNHTTTANVDHCEINKCFYKSADFCPPPESTCKCHQLPKCRKAVVCCNVTYFQLVEGLACANVSNGIVEALHIRNATLQTLNVSSPTWRRLHYMSITNGHIESVVGEFAKLSSISCLNMSSNHIKKFEGRSLVPLYNLSYLDLSHNNITEIPRFRKDGPFNLDISDNYHILCSSVLDSIKRSGSYLQFGHENKSMCLVSKTFHWFNSTELIPVSQVVNLHKLNTDCSLNFNCTCEPISLDFVPGQLPQYSFDVNCSNKGLTALPSPLPPNTVSLDVRNNHITSLLPVSNDTSYRFLRVLIADNNQITSILPLEGSKFTSLFNVLSLRENKISSLPAYLLSNIFDRNNNDRRIHFGLNKLQCDCNTAKILKVWLQLKTKQIPDYNEIYCENLNLRVIDLNPANLCQSQQDWTDYVYYIITFQVLLLVGLIAKVFYDYWIFKTAGYLPWPANKMPKMPCDWLCE